MKRVTRDIDPRDAQDLLERVPRACIAFTSDIGPVSQPVVLVWQTDHYFVGIPGNADHKPEFGNEVVLLVDEGVQFFDLRAIYIRGKAISIEVPAGEPAGRIWFDVVPTKMVAWDYGMLREVEDEN